MERNVTNGEILADIVDGIGHITISRPGKHNSCTSAMWQQIPIAVTSLVGRDVRALVLRGAEGNFCSGADLTEVANSLVSDVSIREYCDNIVSALTSVLRAPVPTIAAMDGVASGGGLELAIAADARIMTHSVRVDLPVDRLGIVPDRVTVRRLLALVGPARARLLIFGDQALSSVDCYHSGLADRVVEVSNLLDEVALMVDGFGAFSTTAMQSTKELLLEEEGLWQMPDVHARMARSMASPEVDVRVSRLLRELMARKDIERQ